jgi:hypothetical protein
MIISHKGGKEMDTRKDLEGRIGKMMDRALRFEILANRVGSRGTGRGPDTVCENLLDRASEAEEMINKGDIFGADLFLTRYGY